jgi:photosystem II stability/assembly factor-like uncharacterized protein
MKKAHSVFLLFSFLGGLTLLSCGGGTASQGGLETWHYRINPLPEGNILRGVIFNNGLFVAVGGSAYGGNGFILTSEDGITWTSRTSGTSDFLSGVSFGNGTFVTVGAGGTILTSRDGISWTSRSSGSESDLFGVTFGDGTFVAIGTGGTILTSIDGISWNASDGLDWTLRAPVANGIGLNAVSYGEGKFVIVSFPGTILTSTDNGTTWTSVPSGSSNDLLGVTFGNGTFVVVGSEIILQSNIQLLR